MRKLLATNNRRWQYHSYSLQKELSGVVNKVDIVSTLLTHPQPAARPDLKARLDALASQRRGLVETQEF